MSDFQECENMPRAFREICRGERLSLKRVNRYRKSWGLHGIGDTQAASFNSGLPDITTIKAPHRKGPGSHLHDLLQSIGITPRSNCSCQSTATKMDDKGVEWCQLNRNDLVDDFRRNSSRYSWGETLKAAWAAMSTGLVWSLSPFDPHGSLVDEAIRRARGDLSASQPGAEQ